jgi:hypothetical protein
MSATKRVELPDSSVDNAAGQQSPGLDPVLRRVEILVNLGQTYAQLGSK